MTPKILFYRYGSICEPDVIDSFRMLGMEVAEETTQIRNKDTGADETVRSVSALLQKERFVFVFSINFFPAVSECCKLFQVPYVCWIVDSPVMELFSPSLENDCNRVFLFDRAQYLYFRHRNPSCLFHLPLATNVARWDNVIAAAPPDVIQRYSAETAFVGSLYREKNPMHTLSGADDYLKGYLTALAEAQVRIYGGNFLEDALTGTVLDRLDAIIPEEEKPYCKDNRDALRYCVAHRFLGAQIAETERTRLLSRLAEQGPVTLYTRSDASDLSGVTVCDGVKTLTEMPLVFHFSRVNLNITMRPIRTGLSLRLFDICGCGGFLLTNYQEELAELYTPGEEAEMFASEEELLDKVAYYLSHDNVRSRIAERGYRRTVEEHTYLTRIGQMIRILNATL